jgi:hypothetical protein
MFQGCNFNKISISDMLFGHKNVDVYLDAQYVFYNAYINELTTTNDSAGIDLHTNGNFTGFFEHCDVPYYQDLSNWIFMRHWIYDVSGYGQTRNVNKMFYNAYNINCYITGDAFWNNPAAAAIYSNNHEQTFYGTNASNIDEIPSDWK